MSPTMQTALRIFDADSLAHDADSLAHFRNYSTVVFAFWRWYVKGVAWLYIQFVKCNTGVILSQSTSTWSVCKKTGLPAVNACPSSIFMRVRVVRVPDFSI